MLSVGMPFAFALGVSAPSNTSTSSLAGLVRAGVQFEASVHAAGATAFQV
jgi:hypothetical protein